VSFGRLDIIEGMSANDVVLSLPDGMATRQISRWHFELRRRATGYMLRAVSDHPTQVDGQTVRLGEEVPVVPGSTVRLANVMTLALLSPRHPIGQTGDETLRLDTR
jgi:predicted component of type VI protein secretion system